MPLNLFQYMLHRLHDGYIYEIICPKNRAKCITRFYPEVDFNTDLETKKLYTKSWIGTCSELIDSLGFK